MANRIIKWFLFTILFAFIPIAISSILAFLLSTSSELESYTNEVLFFTIMISATSLSDIIGLNRHVKDFVLTIFTAFFILLTLLSAIIYGSMTYGQLNQVDIASFAQRSFYLSVLLAIVSAVLGTIIQVLLAKTEVRSE